MKQKLLSIMLAIALFFTGMPTYSTAVGPRTTVVLSEESEEPPPIDEGTEGEDGEEDVPPENPEEPEEPEQPDEPQNPDLPDDGEADDEEGSEDDEEEDEEPPVTLLTTDLYETTHPTHLNEGKVSFQDCLNKVANPGLLVFTAGEVKTTGTVQVKNWTVENTAIIRFSLSNATEGDTITFSITANSEFYGAVPLTVVVTIGYDALTIISDTRVVYGSTLTLACAGLKGTGAVIYTITNGNAYARIDGNILTTLAAGSVTIKAMQVPDGSSGASKARESEDITIVIEKATPIVTPKFTAPERSGQTLSDISLSIGTSSVDGRIEWVLPDHTIVLPNTAYEWKFTPSDYDNYAVVTGTVTPYVVTEKDFIIGEGTTERNADGSYTTTAHGEDDSIYQLTEYPDGRLQLVHRQLDGTVVTLVKEVDGARIQTTEKKDGSLQIEAKLANGLTYYTTKDNFGRVSNQISLPASLTAMAYKNGTVIELPISELPNTDDRADAPTIVFTIATKNPVRVSIPINNPSTGTVAILVDKNGQETIVKTSIAGKDCIYVTLSGSTTVKVVDTAKRFRDVSPSDWFYSSAAFVTSRSLFQGMDAVTFAPRETLSRAMLVQVLHNLEENPRYGIYPFYSDITGTWYAEPASWASYCGYINGYPDGTFRGDEPITREQLAVILYRYLGYPSTYGFVNTTIYDYYDYTDISNYAWSAMYWAVNSGILYTSGSTHLSPNRPATRAEVAQTFQNLLEYLTK